MRTQSVLKQVLFWSVLAILTLLLVTVLFTTYGYPQDKDDMNIRKKAERKYLADSDLRTVRKYHTYIVEFEEELKGDLVITRGDAVIKGKVRGSVITIFGDIEIASTGVILGDAIAVSGNVKKSLDGVVADEIIETSWRQFERSDRYRERRSDHRRWSRIKFDIEKDWEPESANEALMIKYNRVEGLFTGLRLQSPDYYTRRFLNISGFGGYGFKSEKWRYQIGIERNFFEWNRLSFGAKVYDLTDSDDDWIISDNENSVAAVLLKEDFKDYFNRRGVTAYIQQYLIDDQLRLNAEYRTDEYESMKQKASWALFGKGKQFRDNPFIDEGEMRSVYGEVILDTRSSYRYSLEGWYNSVSYEYSDKDMGGDFEFKRFIVDLRRYQPIGRYESLNMRVRLGTSEGALPLQKRFYVGGIGTLNAYRYKEFQGNRLFLTNLEYRFDPSSIHFPADIFDDFDLVLFTDFGYSWFVQKNDMWKYFGDADVKDFQNDIGIGLADREDNFRINLAWKTDKAGSDIMVTGRIKMAF